jgi:hypothetical protein
MATYLHCPRCQRAYNLAAASACPRCAARPGEPTDAVAAIIDAAEALAAAIGRATTAQLAAASAQLAGRRSAAATLLARSTPAPRALPATTTPAPRGLGRAMLALLPRIAPRNDSRLAPLVEGVRHYARVLLER